MTTSMKLGLILSTLIATIVSVSPVAEARTAKQLKCQTVYVLGGTITTCR